MDERSVTVCLSLKEGVIVYVGTIGETLKFLEELYKLRS